MTSYYHHNSTGIRFIKKTVILAAKATVISPFPFNASNMATHTPTIAAVIEPALKNTAGKVIAIRHAYGT